MHTPAGALVYEDLPLPLRVLRDSSSPDIARVRVDSEATFGKLKEFAEHFVPRLAPLIELYTESRPIFDLYGIDDEINRALNRKVPLKSGGYVVFDQTEAMTTIDVNTGAYVGTAISRRRSSGPISRQPPRSRGNCGCATSGYHHH